MNQQTKDHLLGMFLAVLDGRDPRHHVMMLGGRDCLDGHHVFQQCDGLLRAQWRRMDAPEDEVGAT